MIRCEPLIGIDQLSNDLSINKHTLYRKIREKKFPKGIKLHGRWVWKPDVIKQYYDELGITIEIDTAYI